MLQHKRDLLRYKLILQRGHFPMQLITLYFMLIGFSIIHTNTNS